MAGGNSSGGVESYLPIAAALAATIATDGAASPWLVEAMGATAAGAVTSGAAAAAASGLTAAATGQDVGRSALMGAATGGIGGALSGYGAATGTGTIGAATGTGTIGAAGTETVAGAAPLTGANVAGTTAFTPAEIAAGVGTPATSGLPVTGAFTPAEIAAGQGTTTYGGLGVQGTTGANIPAGVPGTEAGGIGGWLANNKGIATLGGTAALGYLINQDNKKYGTPDEAPYEGPLTDFHYSRENYTPLTTAQPSPAYKPTYPNYKANPYNAYAATGAQGGVVAMANGGIAMANPSVGPVEQMSRDNSTGNNQMFPQAGINSPSFASATNRPMGTDMVADTSVDPYTGMQRFAEGGTAEAQGTPLQAMPNLITQNSVAKNNALTQDLVSRMAARNAVNPVPGQTPPVSQAPAGIMAAAPYAAPTFNRLSNIAPIEFQNPGAIVGTKPYSDRIAAEAAAVEAQNAERDAAQRIILAENNRVYDASLGGAAAGGLMPGALRYAHGGTAQSHLGGYSDGGRLLKGPGDGMSDNIPAQIGAKQPARLADGEFVVSADVVSHLGNGSTDAGAKRLYKMMDQVRQARTGKKKQAPAIKMDKYIPKA